MVILYCKVVRRRENSLHVLANVFQVWPEVTNPEKFVYEDVAIASYLLVRTCVPCT